MLVYSIDQRCQLLPQKSRTAVPNFTLCFTATHLHVVHQRRRADTTCRCSSLVAERTSTTGEPVRRLQLLPLLLLERIAAHPTGESTGIVIDRTLGAHARITRRWRFIIDDGDYLARHPFSPSR